MNSEELSILNNLLPNDPKQENLILKTIVAKLYTQLKECESQNWENMKYSDILRKENERILLSCINKKPAQ